MKPAKRDWDTELVDAVAEFWKKRAENSEKTEKRGKNGEGSRGAVRGGGQLLALAELVASVFRDAGFEDDEVLITGSTEIPGYYRSEKKWDLLVFVGRERDDKQLVAAIELKSQMDSFGKNFNNRAEESIGCACDLWRAFREGRYSVKTSTEPFLGYLFLLADSEEVHAPVKNRQTHYRVDPVFAGARGDGVSYAERYAVLLRRLVLERKYSASCLLLSSIPSLGERPKVRQPFDELGFRKFLSKLLGAAVAARGV
jgi:hypothetical protein